MTTVQTCRCPSSFCRSSLQHSVQTSSSKFLSRSVSSSSRAGVESRSWTASSPRRGGLVVLAATGISRRRRRHSSSSTNGGNSGANSNSSDDAVVYGRDSLSKSPAVATAVAVTSRSREHKPQAVVVLPAQGALTANDTADHGKQGLPTTSCVPPAAAVASAVENNIVSAAGLSGASCGASPQQSYRSLVLDSAYRPINVANWFRAFSMAYQERAEVVSYYEDGFAWSGQGAHPLASVIRVFTLVDLKDVGTKVTCNRRNVMVRDRYTCVYCGCHRDLTLDHVVPVSRGGQDTWSNLVTACMACNQRKGSNTLQMLGWRLKREPWEPTSWEVGMVAGLSPSDIENPHPEWTDYLAPYRQRLETIKKQREEAGESG